MEENGTKRYFDPFYESYLAKFDEKICDTSLESDTMIKLSKILFASPTVTRMNKGNCIQIEKLVISIRSKYHYNFRRKRFTLLPLQNELSELVPNPLLN